MMPFDNKLTHVGGCDLFATALDKNSLEVQWTAKSGLDEGNGDTQHFNENFTSMAVNNGEVSLYGYVIQDQNSEKTITQSLAYTCSNGTATNNDVPPVGNRGRHERHNQGPSLCQHHRLLHNPCRIHC